jgi:hypothetical protein
MLVEFIEAPVFTRLVGSYLSDDDYRLLQWTLAKDPERGDVVPGTGGIRKLRWEDRRRGKGKTRGPESHVPPFLERWPDLAADGL